MKSLSAAAVATALLAGALPARAYIETLYPLQQFIVESDVIAEGVVEKTDARKNVCTVRITKSIKGRCAYEQIRLNIGAGQEWHPEAAMRHLVPGAPAVIFYNAERRAEIYVNRFFLQLYGDPVAPPEKAWWTFTHIEIRCNRTFNGTAEELAKLLIDVQAGGTKPPPVDPKCPAITKESMQALPVWGQPVDADKLPTPFIRRDPSKPRKAREAENPVEVAKGLLVQYYEGTWDNLPDFDALKPVSSGTAEQIDTAPKKREENFGLRFTGFLDIPREGTYTFHLNSDDGSRMLIGREEVVANDGLHPAAEASGDLVLKAGKHAITILFFQKSGGAVLDAFWEGPDLPKQKIPGAALHRLPAP